MEEVLPIWKVDNNCLLSKQADLTMAFKITLPEIFTLTDAEYEALTQAWVKAIRVLPNHTILHKQDWFLESSYKADISPEDITFLAKSSERYFHERPYLNHESYIFITKKALDGKAKAITSTIFKSSVVPAGAINDKQFNSFIEKVGQFTKIIEDSGFIKVKPLTSNEIAGTSDKTGILERYCYLLSPNELPVIKDISLDHNLKVGDYTTQIFSLSDVENLPSQCSPTRQYDKYSTEKTKFHVGFATPLTQLLSCNHIYNQYIVIGDAQLTLKNLESKRLRLQSLSAYSRENSLSRDAVNDYLNESISEQRLPVQAHFNLITWTNNEQQIKEIRNNVSASLAQMDVKTKQESISTAQLFIAGIPGAAGYLPTFETFETFCEQAVCFFAQETSYQTSLSPVGLRLGDRITGFPLHTDISDEPVIKQICQNRAKFVLGPSGSGKSFFTNHYLRNYYEQGSHVLIIDVGHSYAGLCELVGGRYFTYSIDNPIAFNPFIVQGPIDTEKKESLKNLLLALWKRDNETYSQSEYVAISNALQLYFILLSSDHSILPGFNSFYEFIRDRFAPSLAGEGIHDKHFDIQNFLYVLKPYYKGGEYDFLLNAKENMDLVNERFLVFEIDSIQNHAILYKVTTIIIMEIFLSKIRRLKGIRKIILVEEAWKAIAKDSMAEYIKYLWKTIRKHYGEPVIVTQEVDDIISSNVIKDAIINNSDTKILLDQTKYINKFNQVQELLGLTDKDKTLILSMNKNNDPTKRYKEVFINLGGIISKVYRTEVSLEEYLCYTTEEKEKMLVQQYAKKYGSLQKGIQILAAEIRDKTISLTPVIFKNSA
jgi:conjugation system TraG family ATPase